MNETTKTKMPQGKRERQVSDDLEGDDDSVDDEDYKPSDSNDECKRSYTTRRNTKIPEEKEFPNIVQTSAKISEEQTEVTASMAKKMRKEGPGGPKLGFARKSTRAFAIKSSHRRVKPKAEPEKCVQENKMAHGQKCTRSLFNGEKACYLIDAKQEGNLARYINHSCNPNLFVQNVFVDTHDLRFPWVAFFTSKRIRAGTELTWDYSYEVGSVEGKVLLCCCGSSECTGRLL
ncbi:histone-lysine N-methyltransferase SETDB1-A isoform X1 [Tachysurus ichikawai]